MSWNFNLFICESSQVPVLFYCAELTTVFSIKQTQSQNQNQSASGRRSALRAKPGSVSFCRSRGERRFFRPGLAQYRLRFRPRRGSGTCSLAQAKEDSKHKMCRFCVLPASQPNETSPEWIAFVLYARYECQARAGEFDSRAFAWSCSLDKFRPIGFTRGTTDNARPRGTERWAARRGKKWAQRGIDTEPTNSIAKPFDPTLYPATWFKILSSTHTNGGDARP